MICIGCESDFTEDMFPPDSPLCKLCLAEFNDLYSVEYSRETKRHTRLDGCLRLIAAIRKASEVDGQVGVEDFEAYWIHTPPWNHIITSISEGVKFKNNDHHEVIRRAK